MKYILLLLFIINCHCLHDFFVFTIDMNLNPCHIHMICNDTKSCNEAICNLTLKNDNCSRIVVFVPDFSNFSNRTCNLIPGQDNQEFYGLSFGIDVNRNVLKKTFVSCQGIDDCVNAGCFMYYGYEQMMWIGFLGICLSDGSI
jgi:hypothetical protein